MGVVFEILIIGKPFGDCGDGSSGFGSVFENFAHFPFEVNTIIENERGGLKGVDIAFGGLVNVGVDTFADDVGDFGFVAHNFTGDVANHANGGGDGIRVSLRSRDGIFLFGAAHSEEGEK